MLRSSVARGTSCNDGKLAMVTDVCNFSNGGTYDFDNVVTAMVDPTHSHPDDRGELQRHGGGRVARTSAAVTTTTITATSRCAGVQDSRTYVEVTRLVTFTKPLIMVVEVSFTIFEVDQAAPVVVSFTTGDDPRVGVVGDCANMF